MAAPIESGAQVNATMRANILRSLPASRGICACSTAIDKNTDINFQNEDCESALIVAAIRGQNDFSAMLIEKGADVNQTDNLEHSAMHYASGGGYTEIMEQLIIAGAEN